MQILFVCTGNTCRSPMAQEIAKFNFKNRGIDAIIESRGIYVVSKSPSVHAVATIKSLLGISIQDHVPKRVSRDDIEKASLIMTMSPSHKAHLDSVFPDCAYKIHTIAEFCGEKEHIDDPFGGTISDYSKCAAQLQKYIRKMEELL
ncbi:MAG: low molecular weight protein arginine phosphatase [Defluviitaleaceae bacterium]|nr:low molecular weight protein arginine phosphatase [Defluviitaleaceae bacterium]